MRRLLWPAVGRYPIKFIWPELVSYLAGQTLNKRKTNMGNFHSLEVVGRDSDTQLQYCRSGNIREVLILANFARRTNSRI